MSESVAKCRERLLIDLQHFRQKSNWDCGIACVLMVLPKDSRQELLDNFAAICKEEGFNRSTWTIDLCYLLRRFRIKHRFFTTTLGVHPGYKGHTFYDHIYTKDEDRINRKFDDAHSRGIHAQKATITMKTLVNHLKRGPVILLTNARLLNCDICKLNKLSTELRKCLPWPVAYQGHYVVLCGFDGRKVFYRNPSLTDRLCAMSLQDLEDARKSYGTDEDVILIYC